MRVLPWPPGTTREESPYLGVPPGGALPMTNAIDPTVPAPPGAAQPVAGSSSTMEKP